MDEQTALERFKQEQRQKIRSMHTINYINMGEHRLTKVNKQGFKYRYHFFPGFFISKAGETRKVRGILDRLVKEGILKHEQSYSGAAHCYALQDDECMKMAEEIVKELEAEGLPVDPRESKRSSIEN